MCFRFSIDRGKLSTKAKIKLAIGIIALLLSSLSARHNGWHIFTFLSVGLPLKVHSGLDAGAILCHCREEGAVA
jgi:hypothetical protein